MDGLTSKSWWGTRSISLGMVSSGLENILGPPRSQQPLPFPAVAAGAGLRSTTRAGGGVGAGAAGTSNDTLTGQANRDSRTPDGRSRGVGGLALLHKLREFKEPEELLAEPQDSGLALTQLATFIIKRGITVT